MKTKISCISMFVGAALFSATGFASELRVANGNDMRNTIPGAANDPGTLVPHLQIYEGLVTWKENGAVAPMLAEKLPDVSADGLTYTFKLRSGISFHDDTPLTPTAVVKTWNWYLNPKNNWPCRVYFDGTGPIKVSSVEAKPDNVVVFKLEKAAPEFVTQMGRTDCMDTAIMAESMADATARPPLPIGTGPFKMVGMRAGQDISMVKFDKYKPRSEPSDGWSGKKEALVDKLTIVVIPDSASTNAALLAGNIDLWHRIDLAYADELAKTKGIKVTSAPTPSIYTLAMQTAEGPLQNAKLRQAISYAIDRKAMTDALTAAKAIPSSSIIPTSSAFYAKATKDSFNYNPEKAKQLLKEAGYKGEVIKITSNKNFPIMYETAVLIQGYLQVVGIKAELEVNDFATQFSRYYSGKYDMMTWNYSPSFVLALLYDFFTGSKEVRASKLWTNPEARKTVDELLRTPIDQQQPIYDKLHKMFMEDVPMLVWATSEATSANKDSVKGYHAWAGRNPRLWGVSNNK